MASSDSTPRNPQPASDQPLIPPPPGVTSNFTNPPDHGGLQIIVTSLLLGVTTLFLLSRIYLKVCIVKIYTWDDRKFMKVVAVPVFNVLKTVIHSDGHRGICEYRHKLLTTRTVSAKTLHVAPQCGSVAYYAAGMSGKEPSLSSLAYCVYK